MSEEPPDSENAQGEHPRPVDPEIAPHAAPSAAELAELREAARNLARKEVQKLRRWRWHHRAAVGLGGLICFVGLALFTAYLIVTTAAFQNATRERLIATIEETTGGRAEVSFFSWDPLHLTLEARGITIHGLEAANEEPYAHIDRIRVEVGVLGLFTHLTPRLILKDARIDAPAFHLIVYPDGSTNQPHPRLPYQSSKSSMQTLFDARIGHLAVVRGHIRLADHTIPLDLDAHDASLRLNWVGGPLNSLGVPRSSDSYRISLSLADLAFAQGKEKPVSSRIEASIQLYRNWARLDLLTLRALDHTLTLRGQLNSFTHPEWRAEAAGDVDLSLLAPYTGFAYVRSGIVHLESTGKGSGAAFSAAGSLRSDAIHYQDDIVDAQTTAFSARFHADRKQLAVADIRTKLARGGEVDGDLLLDNWLDYTPAPAQQLALKREHKSWPVPTGEVKARLAGISLDTILALLANPQYQHLGLDTLVSGLAVARWSGLAKDLEIGGQLGLQGSAVTPSGEAPVHGSVDAVYHEASGSIDVRALNASMPHSSVSGHGSLGVYPITRASAMNLDLVSSDLGEFDAVLRTLDLKQGRRLGAAALPVNLKGQASFHGQFSSNWLTPHIDGHLAATMLDIQFGPAPADPAKAPPFVHWDSLDLDGLYAPASITVRHALLRRGDASVTLAGRMDASDPAFDLSWDDPEFDANSTIGLKITAQQFPISELLTLAGVQAPITGRLNAQVELRGALNQISGAGAIDLDRATLYGESIEHVHATGSVAHQQIRIASLAAQQSSAGGRINATGSYDLHTAMFTLDAKGSGIDLGALNAMRELHAPVTAHLGFSAAGAGSLRDPRLQADATVSKIAIAGQPVADLAIHAAAQNRSVSYDLSSHQPAGQFSAHGVTSFDAGMQTKASVAFSRFDLGGVLQLLKIKGLTGQSDLEGTASLAGPLAHPEKLSGEATLNQLSVLVEGIHLRSNTPIHAALDNGVTRLDPVEITGEDTDLKVNGTLGITGSHPLHMQASGAVNLRLAASLDPDLTASGATIFTIEAHGPLADPSLQGKVQFQNAALALQDFPNGLSQIQGSLEFIQNRLEVRSLTAMSGGGQLKVGGYLALQHGLYADLSVTGKSIRIRYPQGVSSLADATLRLQGPQNNLLLSGNVLVTRFAINSDLDIAALTSSSASIQPIVSPDAPSNHIRFNVHLASAPQLNFQNAYAKLAGDADLHLRGTLASPSLLGRISLTEGSTSIGGTRYELQRGDIFFNNPVRIQPNIDIDATARVEDYDITLGLHGTPENIKVSYRSEPPLPEADVIALLALGRTQDEQSVYAGQQQQAAGDNPTTNALLGGALNATVSNRVQRLFGTGAIKVDPNFIGSLGNSTARVTVVEQVGQNLTFTYASNVNTTTQQLIQAEIAINRHVSILLTQDESGIFSAVIKNRRRFR